ncbi:MAG TPA: ATP-binding protein [Kouleothrix sp.]|uniref:PAS domain-containing sensor histidine kinase n=1 Tax=Kouleothrix sp. TaxID=2779161 RepID=UPI002C80E79D|nr:ATP-binding protein [Kouleothrix sp.]HRC75428.1 ATP-binding protein [Kouleothrix sp.]
MGRSSGKPAQPASAGPRQAGDAIGAADHESFRLLVEGVRDYAIFMLDTSGIIVSWNTGAQLIKGYSAAEIIGKHFSIFYPPEDIADDKPARELLIASTQGRYEEEGWRLRKDGSRFWANVIITALHDADGRLRGFGKVTRDLTERRNAEAAREQLRAHEQQLAIERAARDQMAEAVRMRDTFLTVMAHELRTPLTALLGNAQLLLRRTTRDSLLAEREQHNLKVIVDQVERLRRLVLLQLDISRLHAERLQINRTLLDVGALARRVVSEIQTTLTRHTVVYEGPAAPLLIQGDELRLDQVLQNLIENAIKYSPAGGAVRVHASCSGTVARIAVIDPGIGIPPSELPHLFQRFYRAANVDAQHISGLGVGLYLVKELVALHGGTISVASEEHRGSTFTVDLPLASEGELER